MKKALGKIKLLIMDVDGTLTDGKIYMSNSGELFKAFDIKDGCGIHDVLPSIGIVPVVITARNSEIVLNRCKELNITECYQGVRNKSEKLIEICEKYNLLSSDGRYLEVAYIGDDIIDLAIMSMCGFTACPIDAVDEVKKSVNYVCKNKGGYGAVREFIEFLKANCIF